MFAIYMCTYLQHYFFEPSIHLTIINYYTPSILYYLFIIFIYLFFLGVIFYFNILVTLKFDYIL